MLKKPITYEDFDGNEQTEVFYFHLSEHELIDMEVEHEKGFEAFIQKIIETKDRKGLIDLFKQIILLTYGVKSEDGKRFIKSDELRTEFAQTAAYNALFLELATSDKAAAEFLKGVVPKKLGKEIDKAMSSSAEPSTSNS